MSAVAVSFPCSRSPLDAPTLPTRLRSVRPPDAAAETAPAPPVREDAALLARLRAGEESAFAELVASCGGRMLAVARRLVGDEGVAEDVVQEAFLAAFRALPGFEGESRLSTWLHRIVVNAALMRLRAARRRPEEKLDDLLPRFDDTGLRLPEAEHPAERADAALERAEARAIVRSCIARLPETHRTVLVLRDVEALDTEEVSRLLGLSRECVKTRLHRARQALKTLLERELPSRA
ncbi:MAG TPA: sigma-70 family RNA polymerase sigma factor [Myxococcota bacterium]|jgi:RNA polymerase sigma-70 factor (ECF subfamily)|nr:sigma-70 family RNA polymerase sigma factor [Myxococcota bacterium]